MKFNIKSKSKSKHQVKELPANFIAEFLGVHPNTVTNMVADGRLKSRDPRDVLEYAKELGRQEERERIRNLLE